MARLTRVAWQNSLLVASLIIGGPTGLHGQVSVRRLLREVNTIQAAGQSEVTAISHVRLIDGRGGPPIEDATVVVRGDRIVAVGPSATTRIPPGAEPIDGQGKSLLPGLIDAHFHLDGDQGLPSLYLKHGVTSVRDPGAWIEAYDSVRRMTMAIPRLFLAGPHLDNPPPAYPEDSYLVRDAGEAKAAVDRFVDQGASVIKVYFRLPLGLLKAATEAAHARGVPVTAHLEIVDATDAIRAGVDGIEHITSLGTALLPPRDAERYRQAIFADNNARRDGRYRVWASLDLDGPRAASVLRLAKSHSVFLSPTLAVFEKRSGDAETTETQVAGFARMMRFAGMAKKAGARIVVGSHSSVPHAERGWAYQREMELLVESGLTPMEAIVAGTLENARFFRVAERLGSIEIGKQADLLLVEGQPDHEITAMRKIGGVMLSGKWIE